MFTVIVRPIRWICCKAVWAPTSFSVYRAYWKYIPFWVSFRNSFPIIYQNYMEKKGKLYLIFHFYAHIYKILLMRAYINIPYFRSSKERSVLHLYIKAVSTFSTLYPRFGTLIISRMRFELFFRDTHHSYHRGYLRNYVKNVQLHVFISGVQWLNHQ